MDQICTPLPDELARSHLIRLQRINSIPTPDQALKHVAFRHHRAHGSDPVPARRLARVASVCPDKYVQQHTFAPYWMPRLRDTGARLHNSSLHSLAVPAPVLSFCHLCTAEDTRTFGFSYWRRKHQLAGASFCSVHHTALSRTRHGAPRTANLPAEHKRRTSDAMPMLTSAQQDAVLQYQALGERLLGRATAISPNRTLLNNWVRSRLGQEQPAAAALHLQRRCSSAFGDQWLQQVWGSTTKRSCQSGIKGRLWGITVQSGSCSTDVVVKLFRTVR